MNRVERAHGAVVCKCVAARVRVGGGVWRERVEEDAGRAAEARSAKTRSGQGMKGWASGGGVAGSGCGWVDGRAMGEQGLTQRRTVWAAMWARDTRTRRLRRRRERSGRGGATRREKVGVVAQTEHGVLSRQKADSTSRSSQAAPTLVLTRP